MTVGNSGGCLTGQVVLRIPMLDPSDMNRATSIPLRGVIITVRTQGSRSGKDTVIQQQETDADGLFRFDGLPAGAYQLCVDPRITRDDGSQFQLWRATQCQPVDILNADPTQSANSGTAEDCVDVGVIHYTIEFLDRAADLTIGSLAGIQTAAHQISTGLGGVSDVAGAVATDVERMSQATKEASESVKNHKELIYGTASSIAGIESALRDMATFPFTGPSTSENGGYTAGKPRHASSTSNGVRSGVASALASVGLTGDLTDDNLAQLFPAETNEKGEVRYRWSGPLQPTRTSARSSATRAESVQVSGALARFQQQARVALAEIQQVFATLQPFSGHDVDPETLLTQKKIVLKTMESIVDEPERPDGVRQIAVDLHFKSLLDEPIVVDREGTSVDGNLGVLEYMLGVSDALIDDQDAEVYVTEWTRVLDAAMSARTAWDLYTDHKSKPELRFGERLQDLHGYFGALSAATMDARAMLRTVRFTPQEQATHKFSTSTSGQITTHDLLSMVEDLATDIGPTYITDWRGRGIATLRGRVERLGATVQELVNATSSTGLPTFPFSSARVKGAFEDIARLLNETAAVCDQIMGDMLPSSKSVTASTKVTI